jgi:rhomboid domain-containing protein 1
MIRQQRHQPSPFVIGLIFQIYQHINNLPIKPPVTIFFLTLNILIHVLPIRIFDHQLSNISENCLNPEIIVLSFVNNHKILFNRIIFSALIHVDDIHLYYNMLSLLWKGIQLELNIGSEVFLKLVAFSILVSHSLVIIITYLCTAVFGFQSSGFRSCAVGFSAVLFSLKYVLNHSATNDTHVMGITLPTKYAAWAELILVYLISPNSSFIGHLCGILAGNYRTQNFICI